MKQFDGKSQALGFSRAGPAYFQVHNITINPVSDFFPFDASLALHCSPTFTLVLLQSVFSRFFKESAVVSSDMAQPLLEPSLFGPIPILWEKQISVIFSIVHFAL